LKPYDDASAVALWYSTLAGQDIGIQDTELLGKIAQYRAAQQANQAGLVTANNSAYDRAEQYQNQAGSTLSGAYNSFGGEQPSVLQSVLQQRLADLAAQRAAGTTYTNQLGAANTGAYDEAVKNAGFAKQQATSQLDQNKSLILMKLAQERAMKQASLGA
jgi:hypothetical protein